jgi:hypothetical protein
MSWQDTKFDTGEETRVLQKVRDVERALLIVVAAYIVSLFI